MKCKQSFLLKSVMQTVFSFERVQCKWSFLFEECSANGRFFIKSAMQMVFWSYFSHYFSICLPHELTFLCRDQDFFCMCADKTCSCAYSIGVLVLFCFFADEFLPSSEKVSHFEFLKSNLHNGLFLHE